jgi:hypothetical protein
MNALVAGGTVVGHGPDFGRRLWAVDTDRRVSWIGEESAPHRLANPVPGDAAIVCFDAWTNNPTVVLSDGEVFRCHATTPRQGWCRERSLLAAANGVLGQNVGTLALAGFERRPGNWWLLWMVSNTRQLVVSDERLVPPVRLGTPLPGDSKVLAVRLVGAEAEVLTADGSLFAWSPHGWVRRARMPEGDLVIAGCERKDGAARRWWAVTASRELLVADRGVDAPTLCATIPGTAGVVAVRLWNQQVTALCSDGQLVGAFAKARATPVGNDPGEAA